MGDMSREPSMEDILSSIRRVIAREDAPDSRTPAPTPSADADGDDGDVLDLDAGDSAARVDAAEPVAVTDEAELISPASADAARHALDSLSAVVTPDAAGSTKAASAPALGNRTLEDVVVDAMRPMLKQWLDANLPEMVEAMVSREIRRITGRSL